MPKQSREYSNFFRFPTEPHVFQQSQAVIWICRMTYTQVSRKISADLRIGRINFGMKRRTVIQAKRFFFSGHTRYLLACDWFINLGVDWCLGIGKYQSNSVEKHHHFQSVDATDRETFKENFPQTSGLMLLLIHVPSRKLSPYNISLIE